MDKRIEAMVNLDVALARKISPSDFSDDVVMAALHKSRCEMAGKIDEITNEMVHESIKWLIKREMKPGINI